MNLPLGNCQNCGPNKRTFAGDDAAAKFCAFLFDMKHVVALAHNSQGYDGHFIMQYLHKQDMPLKNITRGLKTISISVGSVRLIDSFNFLPMALSAMPKAFDETGLKKGYFPHLFNTQENQNYIGQWPDASFYSPASMSAKSRDTFYKWYNKQNGNIFEFNQQGIFSLLRKCGHITTVLSQV